LLIRKEFIMTRDLPPKDPTAVEPYFIVWCDKDGTNDGTANDKGELQGATISTSDWTMTGITEDSDNKQAITIAGVDYGANTVATVWLSGGTDGTDYDLLNKIVTSDSRTLEKTITVRVRNQ
jgi:hypothetical protein